MLISFVIPLCDEVESLELLHRELVEVAVRVGDAFEIIFVDDGSTDGSWGVITKLAQQDCRVRGLRFRKNFGKAAALMAGFQAARGDLIFTLDADRQDDPHEIPQFLAAMNQGYDLVTGWKQVRHDPWHKVIPSRVFNWLVSTATGVVLHDHNCGMKCYRRRVTQELKLYGGLYRFVTVLAASRGFKVAEIVVHHRPREHGHSKYGWTRFFQGTLDLVTVWFRTQFGDRPQYLFGSLATVLLAWGILALCIGWSGFGWISIVIAVQLFATGLVAEIVAVQNASHGQAFSIAETIGKSDEA